MLLPAEQMEERHDYGQLPVENTRRCCVEAINNRDKRSENIDIGIVAPAKLENPMKYITCGRYGRRLEMYSSIVSTEGKILSRVTYQPSNQ